MSLNDVLQSFKQLDGDLYLTQFPDGTEIVFRLPSFTDALRYKKILSLVQDNNLEELVYEHIFKECTIDPYITENDNLPAGIISSLVGVILHLSMAVEHTAEDVNLLLNKYREINSSSYLAHMKRTICSVFLGYKLSDLDDLNYQKLLETFVAAEQVLIERGIIEHEFNYSSNNEEEQESIADRIKKDIKEYTRFNSDNIDRMSY